MKSLLLIATLLVSTLANAQQWSIEYGRGFPSKGRGQLELPIFGHRVLSHAFKEPAQSFFRDDIPKNARVELVICVTESESMKYGTNLMREVVPVVNIDEVPPRIGLTLQRDWSSANGRFFSAQRIELRPGTHRLIVPVDPWAWVNVYGKPGNFNASVRRAFVRNWTEPARIGICAGGFFHAHGIEAIEGQAVITIKSLRVLP